MSRLTEFAVPTANSQPYGMVTGPDGNLWFTEDEAWKIGRMNSAGDVTGEFNIPLSHTAVDPTGPITVGPDGNLWYLNYTGRLGVNGYVGQITPDGNITEYSIPGNAGAPSGITTGPDGNVWFTQYYTNQIGVVTPAGTFREFNVPSPNSNPSSIVAGSDGNLWFTEFSGNKIARITTAGDVTEFMLPGSDSQPVTITNGPDGDLWFTEGYSQTETKIGRISTSGIITEYVIPTSNSYPFGITTGPDGNLWFTEVNANKIGRVSPQGAFDEFAIPTANSQPNFVTTGPDGNIWFTEFNANQIGRLNVADQIATATALTPSANPSVLGQSVTFTAAVTPQSSGGTPTGFMQFQVDSSDFNAPVMLSGGSASITTSSLSPGSHTITAIYSGDTNFLSSSANLTQTVSYNFSGFLTPVSLSRAFKQGSSIPIKWQLTDASGVSITRLNAIRSLVVTLGSTTYTLYNGDANTSSYTSGGTVFRNDGSQYIFNWSTQGFATGSYTLTATLDDGTIKSKTVVLSRSGGNAGLFSEGAGLSSATAGGLLAGGLTLYIDASNAGITNEERARILDAVSSVEALVCPYGTNIFVVDSFIGDNANIVVEIDNTSAVGGQADGVLGCTADNGLVTIIGGWNWYAGSEPSSIGSSQYDFQTVVTHELGHALGLGHSGSAASVMYPILTSGTTSRAMMLQDLDVPDSDPGACGLHVQVTQATGTFLVRLPNIASDTTTTGTDPAIRAVVDIRSGVATIGASYAQSWIPPFCYDAATEAKPRRNSGMFELDSAFAPTLDIASVDQLFGILQ